MRIQDTRIEKQCRFEVKYTYKGKKYQSYDYLPANRSNHSATRLVNPNDPERSIVPTDVGGLTLGAVIGALIALVGIFVMVSAIVSNRKKQ